MPLSTILSPQRNCFVSVDIFSRAVTRRNFRLPVLMNGTQPNRKLDAAAPLLSCVSGCSFLHHKGRFINVFIFNDLPSKQLKHHLASSKISKHWYLRSWKFF